MLWDGNIGPRHDSRLRLMPRYAVAAATPFAHAQSPVGGRVRRDWQRSGTKPSQQCRRGQQSNGREKPCWGKIALRLVFPTWHKSERGRSLKVAVSHLKILLVRVPLLREFQPAQHRTGAMAARALLRRAQPLLHRLLRPPLSSSSSALVRLPRLLLKLRPFLLFFQTLIKVPNRADSIQWNNGDGRLILVWWFGCSVWFQVGSRMRVVFGAEVGWAELSYTWHRHSCVRLFGSVKREWSGWDSVLESVLGIRELLNWRGFRQGYGVVLVCHTYRACLFPCGFKLVAYGWEQRTMRFNSENRQPKGQAWIRISGVLLNCRLDDHVEHCLELCRFPDSVYTLQLYRKQDYHSSLMQFVWTYHCGWPW